MYTLSSQMDIQKKAISALNRLYNNQKSITESAVDTNYINKKKYESIVTEVYDESVFAQKSRIDRAYFEIFLSKIEESEDKLKLNQLVDVLFEDVRAIYEHSNVLPVIYANQRMKSARSEEELLNEAASVIKEFVNRNLYSLSQAERDKLYKDRVIQEARDLVLMENIDVDSSVEIAQKNIILNEFVDKVMFPFMAKSKINELLISEEYAEFFDRDKLAELYEQYQKDLSELSLLLSFVC
jgi:hypothetical protein